MHNEETEVAHIFVLWRILLEFLRVLPEEDVLLAMFLLEELLQCGKGGRGKKEEEDMI